MQQDRIFAGLLALALLVPVAHGADTLYDERFKRWTEEAEAGDPVAQYKLGNAYVRGIEVARDYGRAAEWFAKAAAQDDAKALYKLGYLHLEGKGVTRDYKKAYGLLRKSAQQEYSPAQFYLGRLYAEGQGVEQDYRKALYWLTRSAKDNYSPAKDEASRVRALVEAEEQAAQAAAEAAAQAAARSPQASPQEKAPDPAPRPQPVKTAAVAAPAPKKETPPDIKKLFVAGNWLNEGGAPSKHMPSELTKCENDGDWVVCKTDRLRRTNLFARIDYMVEAKFSRFSEKGTFMGTYRENVLSVLPEDPDNPNPSDEDVPSTGWKVRTMIRCTMENRTSLDCVNDNFEQEHFVRE